MKTETVYLSLGSNLGNREENIFEALRRLEESLGVKMIAVSDLIETESWGFQAPRFVNAAAAFEAVDIDPFTLLDACKDIEAKMGRIQNVEFDSEGRRVYHSRIIDIDILLIGDRKVDDPRLKIPHPLMEKRDFVMIPLRQVMEKLNN